jgi:hypothetical protein
MSLLHPTPLFRLAVIGLLVAASASCQSNRSTSTEAEYPPLVSSDFGEMRNVSVAGPIWIGARPSEADLELARRRGICHVIDLSVSGETASCDVPGTCRRLGLEYFSAALPDTALPGPDAVDLILDRLAAEDLAPTLMFDGTGSRCAIFLAIYRAAVLRVPLEDALGEARRAGMKPGDAEEFVEEQVARLDAEGKYSENG